MPTQFTRRHRRQSTSAISGKTYRYDIEVTDLDAKEAHENFMFASGVAGSIALSTAAVVTTSFIFILCLLGTIPIALSSWPLFPLIIAGSALACLSTPGIRAVSGIAPPLAVTLIGIFVSFPASIVGLYAHGHLSDPLLHETPGWEDHYAAFIHLPWIAALCLCIALLISIRKQDKRFLIPCVFLTLASLSFSMSKIQLDQITAALNLALSTPIIAWLMANSLQRKQARQTQMGQ